MTQESELLSIRLLQWKGITFDYAVPQTWLDEINQRYDHGTHRFVWVYPKGSLFGLPYPVDEHSEKVLKYLDEPYLSPKQVVMDH